MKIYDFDGKKNICGKMVKTARKKMKLSQTDLAAKLQTVNIIIDQRSISRLELGDRFVADYELKALGKILNVSVNWLLQDETEVEV